MEDILDKEIKVRDILQYSYYDDQHNLSVVLDVDKIKQLFNADIIKLYEAEHR